MPRANGRNTDLYTKSGDIGAYSAYLILSPDHGVGFTVLVNSASTIGATAVARRLADALVSEVSPAVEEAGGRFVGGMSMRRVIVL